MIFETERLIVRRLNLSDLNSFHKMESNPNVLRFADGSLKSLEQNAIELTELIKKYDIKNNNFWIYGVQRKEDEIFVGTIAIINGKSENEIGYRFLEKYWNNGFGFEVCKGLITYCKKIKLKSVFATVVIENFASVKIVEKLKFTKVAYIVNDKKQQEIKYELQL